jgi:chromosomal replication initiation ATPase DnaA
MQSEEIWEIIQSHLRKKLTPQQYKTWANPLLLSENEQSLEIVAPNHFIKQWISERFAKDIEALAKEHKYLKPITFETNNKKLAKRPEKKEIQKEDIISTNINVGNISKSTGLNKNLNFENFVTGRANQLATAAAKQVSEKPGESYNPLFIYGGVGLGKTHLLQSIGNKVKADNKDLKIKYLHAEKYVTDVVKAYEGKTFDQFKKNYHSLDLLLIDDIQFIGKKNRTQEEFFYAFNTLIENKKQIIITCDSYPKEIQGVDERLRTRFSCHHPTAVAETIRALRQKHPGKRLCAVFEPRSNTSVLRIHQEQLVSALAQADEVLLAPPHRAERIPTNDRLDVQAIVHALNSQIPAQALETSAILEHLKATAASGDVILIMSNGKFDNLHERLLKVLNSEAGLA